MWTRKQTLWSGNYSLKWRRGSLGGTLVGGGIRKGGRLYLIVVEVSEVDVLLLHDEIHNVRLIGPASAL
jgi:hypothetical protein